MRIISGKYRGRILKNPTDDNIVRPTTDKVKEAIFDSIQFLVHNAKFLDLFAGSGAIGIEAISRGAREVVFVDISRKAIKIIEENLNLIKETSRVINSDYKNAISLLKGKKFNIIFLDPPYAQNDAALILNLINECDILENDGLIIYEHLKNIDINLSEDWEIIKTKLYGIVQVDTIKRRAV